MRFHQEGTQIMLLTFFVLGGLSLLAIAFFQMILMVLTVVFSMVMFGLVAQFFRNPVREVAILDDNIVYAPADGKIVVIETVEESEYFHDARIQVSIFMSPLNVHVNRNPISGMVQYFRYHEGKYLVAWHPKSSTENERTTVVIRSGETEILVRQIAGAVARRIINYLKVGDHVMQGSDMGFIRFGSRVDIFLPLDAQIETQIGQTVQGNRTILARLTP
jgi:phosphatidylserine decarboxylase